MINRFILTDEELMNLKKLISLYLENNLNSDKEWKHPKGYNSEYKLFKKHKSKDIINFVSSKLNYDKDDMNSIHFIRYKVGSYLKRHKDKLMMDIVNPKNSISVTFLLKMCELGGEFYLNDDDMKFSKEGEVIIFEGESTFHEVKEIKKGVREVLVLWYKPKIRKNII